MTRPKIPPSLPEPGITDELHVLQELWTMAAGRGQGGEIPDAGRNAAGRAATAAETASGAIALVMPA